MNWTSPTNDPETSLRIGPLRDHWEARGPGMLKRLTHWLPWLHLPSSVNVHLYEPTSGGGGRLDAAGTIHFAAVLANPLPQLPEIVRLAWLCARLAARDSIDHDLRNDLALIAPTLAAAEYVELATFDLPTSQCATQAWLDENVLTTDLVTWWQAEQTNVSDLQSWNQAVAKI